MKHLDLEVEKLENRIATWIPPISVGVGVGSGTEDHSYGCSRD